VTHIHGDLVDWFLGCIDSLSNELLCKMVMICWGLWSSRNDCVWKGVLFVVDVVLNMSLSLWTNMRSANVVELPAGGMEEPVVLWKKPDARHLKVNTEVDLHHYIYKSLLEIS